MRRLPVLAAAPLIAGALALAAGCGGDDAPDADNTVDLTPEQVLERSADALADAGPYRVALDGAVNGGGVAPGLGGALDVEGEGVVVPGQGFSIDVGVDAGLPVEVTVTGVGGEVYVSLLGRDVALGVPADQADAVDPGRLVQALPDLVEDPVETGREEADGVDVVRIEGAIDADRARTGLGEALAALGAGGAEVPLDDGRVAVLVGVEDLLPRRVEIDAGDLAGEDPALDVALSTSDFGADLQVSPPDDARPLGSGGLGGLLGG
jgi:hypothetical protein